MKERNSFLKLWSHLCCTGCESLRFRGVCTILPFVKPAPRNSKTESSSGLQMLGLSVKSRENASKSGLCEDTEFCGS